MAKPPPTGYDDFDVPVTSLPSSDLRDRVASMIEQMRPAIQADGGDIEFIKVAEDGVVQIRFLGACIGCPSSHMTLHMGIEANLRREVPEVTRVVAVR